MQALLISGEQQVQVGAEVENDGRSGRVGIILYVDLRKEVLCAAQYI